MNRLRVLAGFLVMALVVYLAACSSDKVAGGVTEEASGVTANTPLEDGLEGNMSSNSVMMSSSVAGSYSSSAVAMSSFTGAPMSSSSQTLVYVVVAFSTADPTPFNPEEPIGAVVGNPAEAGIYNLIIPDVAWGSYDDHDQGGSSVLIFDVNGLEELIRVDYTLYADSITPCVGVSFYVWNGEADSLSVDMLDWDEICVSYLADSLDVDLYLDAAPEFSSQYGEASLMTKLSKVSRRRQGCYKPSEFALVTDSASVTAGQVLQSVGAVRFEVCGESGAKGAFKIYSVGRKVNNAN